MRCGFILLIVLCLLLSPGISNYACVGARPMGMGGAFTAVADDINAVYWNPAGLQQLKTCELTYTFEPDRFDDGDFKSAYPHFAAFGFKYYNYTLAIAYIDVSDWAEDVWRGRSWLYGAYSTSVNERLSLGFKLGYREVENPSFRFFRNPSEETLSSVPMLFDLGVLYKYSENVNIGLLIQGLKNIRPAIAVKPNKNLTIALDFYDILNVTEDGNKYQIGAEQMVAKSVIIRTGCYGNDNFTFGTGYSTNHFNLDAYIWFNPSFKEYYRSSLGLVVKF